MKNLIFILLGFTLFSFSYAQTWEQLDKLCYDYGDSKPDSAILLGKKAIEGCIKEKGKNSIEYAVCLDHIAWAYKTKSNLIVADSLYQEAKRILELINQVETSEYAEILNNMGLLYNERGIYSESEPLYKKAKEIDAKVLGKAHPNYARSCNNLGSLYQQQGRYSEAEPLFKEAKEIKARALGKEHPSYAASCNNLALLYESQGRYDEAESLHKEVKEILSKVLGKEHYAYATCCNNLAGLYYSQMRYNEAELLFKESRDAFAKILGKKHPNYAKSCSSLALLYLYQGKYSEAESLNKEAKEIYTMTLGKECPPYARSCLNLALSYKAQGHYNKAEVLYKEGRDILARVLGKESPDYALASNNLAELYQSQNRYPEAESLYKAIIRIKLTEIERNFKNLSETEKEKYIHANINSYFNDFQNFVREYHPQNPEITQNSYDLTMAVKGLILESTEKVKNRILSSKDEKLKSLYLEWKSNKDMYAKVLDLTVKQREQKKINIDSLANRTNELEKELALKSEDFAHTFAPKHITWRDIQNKLRKDQAAIEIVRIDAQKNKYDSKGSIVYMALIVRKNSKNPEIVILPNGNQLEVEYLNYYRRSIRSKIEDEESYNVFWKPIKERLKGIKTVYFSPEGAYHQINLATLQNPDTKKYVCDEIQIINVTNTKDILEENNKIAKNGYLIGNPKFNLGIDTQNNEKPLQQRSFDNISPLEGAENEVKQIYSILPNTSMTIGEKATEEYMKSLRNPRILHIATHGYFKKGQYQSSTQAMLNAGLLFAGVSDYDRMDIRPYDKDDGKLTAFEVMNMELDSTELVVLSACETGLGQASKEGVYGLQRAFKVAGAKCVVMSLWKVNDEATQKLMTKFYENWQQKGMSKRRAFEFAQQDIRKEYKYPYYWGAFVMIE